jgi:uncharacterized lipoprotein YbaY
MRRSLPFLLAACALSLAACQSAPTRSKAAAAIPANATAVLHGSASYLERIAPPQGAALEVQLIADASGDAPQTIAMQRFDGLRGPPYAFDLHYDPTRLHAGGTYSLRAALRDARGHLQFVTPARVPVTPGDKGVVALRLSRAAADLH